MDEKKKRYSKMAVTGFVLPFINALLVVIIICVFPEIMRKNGDLIESMIKINLTALICNAIIPCAGSVFSIIGIITSIRKKLKGKAMAIAGIVLNELEIIAVIVFYLGLFGFMMIGR